MFLAALMALSQAGTPEIEYELRIRPRSGEAPEVHLHPDARFVVFNCFGSFLGVTNRDAHPGNFGISGRK